MKRTAAVISGTVILLLIITAWSLKSGTVPTAWSDLPLLITEPESLPAIIIRELRLPRVLAALLAGSSLALSGVILQKILRNDLASPDILGISGGAGCAGVSLLIFFPAWAGILNFAAFAGALLAAAVIYFAAWKRVFSPVRLILAGVALSALFNTASGAILLCNSDKYPGILEFSMGGFSTVTMEKLFQTLPFFAAAFIFAAMLPKKLELLSLGEMEAHALGLNPQRASLLSLAAAALAAAAAVSLAGLLGFAGLMAPHIAVKLLDSSRSSKLLITAPLIGALLTLSADFAGRTIFAPREVPCGLFLSAMGAIFFLLLLWNRRESI